MDDPFTRKAFVLYDDPGPRRFFVSGCMGRRPASIEPKNILGPGREVDPPAGAVFRHRGKIRSAGIGSFVRCGVLTKAPATTRAGLPLKAMSSSGKLEKDSFVYRELFLSRLDPHLFFTLSISARCWRKTASPSATSARRGVRKLTAVLARDASNTRRSSTWPGVGQCGSRL